MGNSSEQGANRSLDAWLHGVSLAAVLWCLSGLMTGKVLPLYRDLLPFVYPYRAFLAEHLSRGEVPFWNPYVQLGTPFLASLHASVLYPLSLLLLVPLPLGFNLFLLAHFAVAWAGSMLWLRARGASPAGATAGALVFTIGGYLVASVTNTAHLQAAVWAPWILIAWERVCQGRSGFVLTAVLLVIQLLAGAPEVWISTVALLAGWTMFAAPARLPGRVGRTIRLGACVAVAVALAAFQLLPTFEYLAFSRRASQLPAGELTYWSMSPVALLQLLFPHSGALVSGEERGTIGALLEPGLPLVHSIYIGIAGLCLAVAGTAVGRQRIFWSVVAALGVLVALGPTSPVYTALVTWAPDLLGRIRYPEKFLFLFHVGAVVLVSEGATAALRGDPRALRLSVVTAATLAAVTLIVSSIGWLDPGSLWRIAAILSGHGEWPADAFLAAAADLAYKADRASFLLIGWGALAILCAAGRIGRSLFALLAVLLLAGDLASTHRGLWLSIPVAELERAPILVDAGALRAERQRLFHYQIRARDRPVPGLVRWMPTLDERLDLRAFALEQRKTLFFATGMLHGVGVLSADDSIGRQPDLEAALLHLPREHAIDLLGAFGVSVLVGPDELSSANVERLPSPPGDPFLYRIRTARPFAFLVSEVEILPSRTEALARLADPSFPRGTRAVVDRLPEGLTADVGSALPEGRVTLLGAGSDEVELEVTSGAARLLVVNASYFPGWEAEIDGRAATIVRANALVQGVVVPAGRHRVKIAFRPKSFRLGLGISLATLAGLALVGGLGSRYRLARGASS